MKVTVLMAVYNAQDRVAEAVASALAQTLPPKEREVLVVDDGSSDRTVDILHGFGPAVRLLTQPHQGLAKTCNTGLAAARGTYLMRLDADDTLAPEALAVMARHLDDDPAAGCVYSDRVEISPEGQSVLISMQPFNLFRTIACGILFRTEQARSIGGYDELLFEEYDFLLRYLHANPNRLYVPQPLYRYVKRAASLTQQAGYWEQGWQQLVRKWGETELKQWSPHEVSLPP